MAPNIGMDVATYLLDTVLDERFPLPVLPTDPVQRDLGIRVLLQIHRGHVVETIAYGSHKLREEKG